EALEGVPGVRGATLSRHPVLSGSSRNEHFYVQGQTPPGKGNMVAANLVGANFFETMELPIVLGRRFNLHDDEHAPKVAVINQTLARTYFGNDSPLGRHFSFSNKAGATEIEIVGVAGDAIYTSLRKEGEPTAYTPYLQESPTQMNFEVRTAGDAASMIGLIQQTVHQVDADLAIFDVKTQSQQADESLAQERLFARLSGFFGLLVLALVCIG